MSLEDTQKKLDKALKRNLEGQTKAVASSTVLVKQEPPESVTDTED